ncbi:3'-5' exonuclease [Hugenholtzia roseola]|uniref:3'-5' exonuclease n=1 Tax=Hugenholtzia roseola TaxID=1002 RepID=UPI0003F5F263|nr:3'-5' exonuclease [Hugenholtzia roseola]
MNWNFIAYLKNKQTQKNWENALPQLPEWAVRYYRAHRQRQESQSPFPTLQKARFVVFDTETTGLNMQKDVVISLAALRLEAQTIQIGESLEFFIPRQKTGSKHSITIHQILPQETEGGISESKAIEQWLDFIGTDVLVAHHVGFDVGMMESMMNRVLFPNKETKLALLNPQLDTARMEKRLQKHLTQNDDAFSLDALSNQYDLRIAQRHTAAGDTLATAQIFLIQLKKLQKRGIKNVDELF